VHRATIPSLSIGGVPSLGPGYAAGFAWVPLAIAAVQAIKSYKDSKRVGGPTSTGYNPAPTIPSSSVLNWAGATDIVPSPSQKTYELARRMPQVSRLPTLPGSLPGGIPSPAGTGIEMIRRVGGFFGLGGPTGGGAPRRRRMNPLNLRALGRADRRLEAFAKIARRYVSPTAPQKVVRTKRRKR